jgi:hypothetical protein
MYARIASFEGEADRLDEALKAVRAQVEKNWESPPEGLDAVKEMWMLVDREGAKGLGITVYETEEDLRRGDAALNAMTPADPSGRRTNVSIYEVELHKERD